MKILNKSRLTSFCFTLILCSLQVHGALNITVTHTNNRSQDYEIENIKTIRFDSQRMIFHPIDTSLEDIQENMVFPISGIKKISFKKTTTNIEIEQKSSLNIFPNPTCNWIQINNTNKNQSLYLYNIAGTCILKSQTTSECTNIDLSHLEKGVYILRIDAKTEKIIKR